MVFHGRKVPWLTGSLIYLGVGLERRPGKPKVVRVNNWTQLLPGQRAGCGLAQDVPDAPGLVVNEAVAIGPEGERLAIQVSVEYAGRSHVPGIADGTAIQGRKGSRFEEDHQVLTVHGVVDRPFFFQNLEWEGGVDITYGYRRDSLLG